MQSCSTSDSKKNHCTELLPLGQRTRSPAGGPSASWSWVKITIAQPSGVVQNRVPISFRLVRTRPNPSSTRRLHGKQTRTAPLHPCCARRVGPFTVANECAHARLRAAGPGARAGTYTRTVRSMGDDDEQSRAEVDRRPLALSRFFPRRMSMSGAH
jgi:hypothetical protein